MKRIVIGILLPWVQALAWAQQPPMQDDDIRRIPLSVLEGDTEETVPSPWAGSVFIEGNGEAVSRRTLMVPIAPGDRYRRVLRLLADGRGDRQLSPDVVAKLSARFGAMQIDDGERSHDNQFDLREAALQWRVDESNIVELGRVNLRQGAALGFNPTDYFKSRATVDNSTRDPQVQRVNRLGTVVVSAQHVGRDGSLSIALSPRLSRPASLIQSEPQVRLRLGDTNNETRLLIKGQFRLTDSINPELLAFKDSAGWRLGANVTQAVGRQTILFAEYSSGRGKPVLQRALEGGIALGDLPDSVLGAMAPPSEKRWQNSLATGWTWTSANRLSITVEFDYNQAGLSRADWQWWFATGAASTGGAQLAWYLRSYAGAQQDPLFQRNLFLRAQWDQIGHPDLYLNAFVNRDLDDNSSLAQASLEYRVSQAVRLRAMVLLTTGRSDSQYGSDPARRTVLLSYSRYL